MLALAETKTKKQQLGQFFTSNADYVLQGLEKYVFGKNVTDPFAGSGDLLDWAEKNGARRISGFDVDISYTDNTKIFLSDSLLSPKKYDFILTNPPYLNINKAKRSVKEKYFAKTGLEDLYQISLRAIANSNEGIVIMPINFLCAQNSEKARHEFFAKFEILEMNYFKHQVFPDTTYNVIAFYYRKKTDLFSPKFTIRTNIFPDKKKVNIEIRKNFGWLIGGELVSKIEAQENILKIHRLTEEDMKANFGDVKMECAFNHTKEKSDWNITKDYNKKIESNIILLKAIDSGSEGGKIALEDIRNYNVKCLVSKATSRHMVFLVFGKPIPIKQQISIIQLFNEQINALRSKYMSLFLTNYRDKDRKRIGFDFAYKFINFLYVNQISREDGRLKIGYILQ